MLGLGEEIEEILCVMADLREVSCDLLTLGQYLRPSSSHHPVVRYVPPEEFEELRVEGEKLGFRAVFSAPWCAAPSTLPKTFKGILTVETMENPEKISPVPII